MGPAAVSQVAVVARLLGRVERAGPMSRFDPILRVGMMRGPATTGVATALGFEGETMLIVQESVRALVAVVASALVTAIGLLLIA